MKSFLLGILSFLLMIMPWFSGLFDLHEEPTFDEEAVRNKVISCIENNDAAALESMMYPPIRDNVLGLSDKIGQLLNLIEGDIERFVAYATIVQTDRGEESRKIRIGIFTDETLYHFDF